jgi:DNA-binding transcriptional regulator GbsR (MarR family)
MTIQELLAWGVIRRAEEPVDRKRRFEAETDILSLVMRVFRERELRLIEDVVRRLELALKLIEGARSSSPELVLRQRFLATRIQQLLGLARLGAGVVARFAQAGTLDLRSLRDALAARR